METMAERTAGFECVACRLDGHVAVVTLNRPHRRNALNYQAYAELEAAFRSASDDPNVRCVVITGADPAFCSGDDVGEHLQAGRGHLGADLQTLEVGNARRAVGG